MRRSQQSLRLLAGLASSVRTGQRAAQTLTALALSERQLSSQAASTSGHGYSSGWPFAALPLLAVAVAGTTLADAKDSPDQEGFHLLPLASRQRIFFKYEKRIRDMSTLDKVFEYFSSQEKDKHKFLADVDLLRAIVPTYPPSESHLDRSGSLDGERQSARPQPFWSKAQTGFFKQFDVDGDGLISYPEFLLVLTLLSIHERDVKTIFDVVDLDGNGQIDAEEFKAVMELLQAMANVHTSKVGRSHKLSIDSESGILVSFFGKDGDKKLYLPEFQDFLKKLHEEVVKLEFAHYDNMGRGSMAPVDFARSLVATADVRQVDKLLDRVDALEPELLRKRISFDEFLKVHQVERKLHTLQVALDFFAQVGRAVTKPDFVKLLKKLLNVTLPPHVVDIIFAVFTDDKGNLDTATFLEVMQRREIMWGRRKNSDTDGYPPGTLSRAMVCMRRCFYDE